MTTEIRPTIGVDGSVATEQGIQTKFDTIDSSITSINSSLVGKENTANKGIANGYAPLDSNNKIPSSYLTVNAMEYKGAWNASTGSYPTAVNTGDVYRVSVAGTVSGQYYDVNGQIVWNGTTWDYTVPVVTLPNASYTVKGGVQGLTDASTSGVTISSGVISVNTGTGANQIVKLDGSSKLPAVDGSNLTNILVDGRQITASNNAKLTANTERAVLASSISSPQVVKSFRVVNYGTARVKFDYKAPAGVSYSWSIYVDGISVDTTIASNTSYLTRTFDITLSTQKYATVEIKISNNGNGIGSIYTANASVSYDYTLVSATVNTD